MASLACFSMRWTPYESDSVIIRPACSDDAPQIAGLVTGLDHHLSADQVRSNLKRLDRDGLPQLVAEDGDRIVGLLGLDRMDPLYRPRPVGRITILIVADDRRGEGIGRQLIERAIEIAREWGCGMIEVTSNDRLTDAHDYYLHLEFEQTSKRFARILD